MILEIDAKANHTFSTFPPKKVEKMSTISINLIHKNFTTITNQIGATYVASFPLMHLPLFSLMCSLWSEL